jgi:hypothetical protein
MTELFDIPESKSPRLQWIEDMGILTHRAPHMPEPWMAIQPLEEDKGKGIPTIMSESCRIYDDANLVGYGQTEDEAITNLAKNLGLRLWNERGLL